MKWVGLPNFFEIGASRLGVLAPTLNEPDTPSLILSVFTQTSEGLALVTSIKVMYLHYALTSKFKVDAADVQNVAM